MPFDYPTPGGMPPKPRPGPNLAGSINGVGTMANIMPQQGPDPRYIGPAQQGPPGPAPEFVGPPIQGPPGGGPGPGYIGPAQQGPPGVGGAGPPGFDGGPIRKDGLKAVPPGGGPDNKFIGPAQQGGPGGDSKFIGPAQQGQGTDSLFPTPNAVGGPGGLGAAPSSPVPLPLGKGQARDSGSDLLQLLAAGGELPRGTPLQRPGFYPTGEAPTMAGAGEGQPGTAEEWAELLRRQEESRRRSEAQVAGGPLIEGDETENPVGFKRTYNNLRKRGMSHENAIRKANELMAPGQVDRQNRPRFNAVEHNTGNFNTPEYIQQHVASGFLSPGSGNAPGSAPGPPGFEGGPDLGPPGEYPEGYYGQQVQVGQDPFSKSIMDSLGQLMGAGGGATTEFGRNTESTLMDLLANSGKLDEGVVSQRMETVEDALNRLEQQRIKSIEARLASRGLIGSGPQKESLEGISRDIMDIGSGAFRDIMAGEQEAANRRYIDSAGLATGYSAAQPGNLLAAANSGTQRQDILSRIALDQLSQQQDWNMALARLGLDREATMRELENMDLGQIMAVLQSLFQTPQIAQRGYVGKER